MRSDEILKEVMERRPLVFLLILVHITPWYRVNVFAKPQV